MALFQKSVLNKFIKSQDTVKIEAAYQRFSDNFQKAERQVEIRSMKEEEYQDGFLDDLFVNILGYIKRPNAGFNLVREKKNEADSKKADGAILKNDSPLAVIELKGTDTTDLDKVTNQGFGYKNNHKECVYVVISNFEKLRFYIHHAVDYIEFNLFTLSKEDFTTLWLCLHSDNLLDNIPAKIKAESVVKEEDITKNLYKDYSSFKQELWQSIVNLNPEGDPLMFYKKTQKLIDRFLFIFFAEDAGLLPPNSISRMVDRWQMLKDEDAYKPLYDIFKQYFGYINTGRSGKTPQDEIFAYNGGLFVEDKILDEILVKDDVLLKHTLKLTVYDFSSEVDVNILGHIFENSLNDIEAVTAELEGKEIDKSKTKRKKDGVFYTPKYIAKYIVDNTVGKLCDEKKVELDIIDEEYAKGRANRKKETLKKLDENLQAYRNWLLNITICDPACGSGAFLNQALEYLMEEHRYIDELESQLLGAGFKFPGVENHILENNIFGVDINEESIEIAKLSLWLRTAQRGRKLTSLNNNIKCGNSLIDDTDVAGEKAFNWQQEFPTVFEKGGFDVVIGNPPYVLCQPSNTPLPLLEEYKRFEVASYKIDLFHLFFEKSIQIIRTSGRLGFITPNTYLNNKYIKPLRAYILNHSFINELINYEDAVFADAGVDVATLIITKDNTKKNESISIYKGFNGALNLVAVKSQLNWHNDEENTFNLNLELDFNTDFSQCVRVENFCSVTFGLQTKDKQTFVSEFKKEDDWEPCYTGRDVNRYFLNESNLFFKNNFKEVKAGGSWDMNIHHAKKIVVRQVGNPEPIFAYDNYGYATLNTMYSVVIENKICDYSYLLAILNSNFIKKYFLSKYADGKQLFPKIKGFQIKSLPIKIADEESQKVFSAKSDQLMVSNKEFYECIHKFFSLTNSDFGISKLSKKLETFYTLTWSEFEKELSKNKITLLGVQKEDWLDRFERFKKQALDLKSKIDQTDKEIDRMVYELYGLTEEEIQTVKNN
jgi:type I restriction-modification system DNA methylase subunit